MQHGEKPIAPHFNQSAAVRHDANTRANNLERDRDEMIRRVPLYFDAEARDGTRRKDTSMSLELASRALGQKPERQADGTVRLGGWTIPGSERNTILANFDAGNDIPTFSLADRILDNGGDLGNLRAAVDRLLEELEGDPGAR